MQQTLPNPVRVELVLDVICSASYITFTRLLRVIDKFLDQGGEIDLTFLPFELDPGAATEGRPVLEELREMLGPSADQQAAQIAQRATRDGLRLNYDRAIATGTFDAHRLILLASQQGRAAQMVERLFRAHFTDGLHVGDPETLRRLADEVGVVITDDADNELRRRLDLVRNNGIRAIPVLIFDNRPPLVGVQTEEHLFEVLQQQARVGSPR